MSTKQALKEIIISLDHLIEDVAIPKNIRKVISEAKEMLLNEKTPLDVRSATANSKLDELANDPNIPMHARTALWSVMSKLETVK